MTITPLCRAGNEFFAKGPHQVGSQSGVMTLLVRSKQVLTKRR